MWLARCHNVTPTCCLAVWHIWQEWCPCLLRVCACRVPLYIIVFLFSVRVCHASCLFLGTPRCCWCRTCFCSGSKLQQRQAFAKMTFWLACGRPQSTGCGAVCLSTRAFGTLGCFALCESPRLWRHYPAWHNSNKIRLSLAVACTVVSLQRGRNGQHFQV